MLKANICPQLSFSVLNQCKNVGIKTVIEFILFDPEELAKKIKLSYKDVSNIQRALISTSAAFPQNAESLHHDLLDSISILSTGSERLNKYLLGGLYTGEVTEIYGSPGSGKTQFSLSVISKLISSTKNTAFYVDTNNSFVAKHLYNILLLNSKEDKVVKQKLQNVHVNNVYNIYQLFDCLETLKAKLNQKENHFFKHLKLIVIDSITPLLSPCFGGKYLDGPQFMGNLAQQLKILCCEYMISILICNNTIQDQKAALGSNWAYIPSVRLHISKISKSKYKINTEKSCRSGCGSEINFSITEAGIHD